MQSICIWAIHLTCLFTFYQDFKYRAIHWAIIPTLVVLFVSNQFLTTGWEPSEIWMPLISNILFLGLQFVLLYGYMVLVKRENKILDKWIGMGDVLFLLASCFAFSVDRFIIYYITGLVFSLMVYLIFIERMGSKSIPLAGLLAIWMIFFPWVYPTVEAYLPSIHIFEP